MANISWKIPNKLIPVFTGKARYRCAYGGRGSGKTRTFCMMLLAYGMQKKLRILCAREFQNSLNESVLGELKSIIDEYKLGGFYEYTENTLRGVNGTTFSFIGLRHNINSVKSISGIDICFVEEAEYISAASWMKLIPSIRHPGSEIWVAWNPESKDSATKKRFIDHPPADCKIAEINWRHNPWFPAELNAERVRDAAADPDMYAHIWEGQCITRSDAKVLGGKWHSAEFEPQPTWDGPYYGLDFGFGVDPTAGVCCWVDTASNRLYVSHEAGRAKLELDDTARYLSHRIPGIERYAVRADSARPESISYLKRHGLPKIESVKKWPGSVEDGVTFLRAFEQIVIHPRCTNLIDEADRYCYKIDARSGDILPDIVDKHNHYVDALRYAIAPLIRVNNKLSIIHEAL